ncbi:putative effector of murein hydrolase [Terrimicrobium sacchariphilum]|uniref:Putative effector of murein hydrolase n=1 Tax=Terrimicrobium sacchariphilum TaxID=690879 RepID=A0A146GG33_TERSA|nr:LrgB family protein [Terrimicrobium sacchariphilum]GAT35547.1 putative effector of murein hydrolase [Terrimicrobium sacchariphilum]
MNAELQAVLWAAVTLGIYLAALRLYRACRVWWLSPLLVTWVLCGVLIVVFHTAYRDYLRGTSWLVSLIGPTTVAFAIPIHENRALIRKYWVLLLIGTVAGSAISFGSAWALAWLFHLSPEMQASLLPRSITTPFAMTVSQDLGGLPELTAAFTAITGLFGAAIGEGVMSWLPLRSSFARGAFFGMGAHGAGVAKAREIGEEEGAVAGLIMVFAGLLNVLAVVLFVHLRG